MTTAQLIITLFVGILGFYYNLMRIRHDGISKYRVDNLSVVRECLAKILSWHPYINKAKYRSLQELRYNVDKVILHLDYRYAYEGDICGLLNEYYDEIAKNTDKIVSNIKFNRKMYDGTNIENVQNRIIIMTRVWIKTKWIAVKNDSRWKFDRRYKYFYAVKNYSRCILVRWYKYYVWAEYSYDRAFTLNMIEYFKNNRNLKMEEYGNGKSDWLDLFIAVFINTNFDIRNKDCEREEKLREFEESLRNRNT